MRRAVLFSGTMFILTAGVASADWVDFIDESVARLPASVRNDDEEKDYAWGDVDQDGDIDVAIFRKQPFTSSGKRTNVLLINEGGGFFVDRTAEFATASNVPGDNGFLTPTNDRDGQFADFNGDGWLDIVTTTTLSDFDPPHIKNPRVYFNLGEDGNGNWLGFEYDSTAIPETFVNISNPNAAPRFCSVAVGDIDNDGDIDMHHGDYDSGGSQVQDFNNRLLINDGTGHFTDESFSRLTSQMRLSAFGAASEIVDMNNDGANDIVKQTSLNAPTHVAIIYNDPDNPGFFEGYDQLYNLAPYFEKTGDLNNDGLLDMVVVDDGTDRYLIATGIGGDGQVNFQTKQAPSQTNGFGGNAWIADLNNDGWQDAIITDVDVDIPGCGRTMKILRNLGDAPSVTLSYQGTIGPGSGDPTGVHDVAVFDMNGDGWLDMIVGRCNGTEIWINDPPVGMAFAYPLGLVGFMTPNETTDFQVRLTPTGGDVDAGSVMLHTSVDGGPFASQPMADLGDNTFAGVLPAVECTSTVAYYVSAALESGSEFTDPAGAPASTYTAIAAESLDEFFEDQLEGDTSGWTVVNGADLVSGGWEAANPNGTVFNGQVAAPEDDASQAADAVVAFVTENGPAGGSSTANDVDGGPTMLISPAFDFEGSDGVVSFRYWHFSNVGGGSTPDSLTVEVSNDNGVTYTPVTEFTSSNGDWVLYDFVVGDFVEPTAEVRVRFTSSDLPNDSVTESGIDSVFASRFDCGDVNECPADLSGNGSVGPEDLAALLGAWGPNAGSPADFDGDDMVGPGDLAVLLGAWGSCDG